MKQTKVSVDQTLLSPTTTLRSIGIVEQLQKGVTAPEQRGQQVAFSLFRPYHCWILWSGDLLPYQAHTGTDDNKQQR